MYYRIEKFTPNFLECNDLYIFHFIYALNQIIVINLDLADNYVPGTLCTYSMQYRMAQPRPARLYIITRPLGLEINLCMWHTAHTQVPVTPHKKDIIIK